MSAEIKSPIIIIGAGRSGTSLVSAILNKHSSVKMLGEFLEATYGLWRFGWDTPAAVQERSVRMRRRRAAFRPETSELTQKHRLSSSEIEKLELSRVGDILRTSVSQIYGLEDWAGRWGFKEIWLNGEEGRDWKPFDILFPSAYYIQLIRNPFDFAISYAAWNRQVLTLDNLKALLLDWKNFFYHNHRVTLGGRYQLIRYETLIAEPERTVAKILRGLGLEMKASCLSALKTSHVPSKATKTLPIGAGNLLKELLEIEALMRELHYEIPAFPEAATDTSDRPEIAARVGAKRWLIKPPYLHTTGHAWVAQFELAPDLFPLAALASTVVHESRSPLRLYEDGVQLGPPNARHNLIRRIGLGNYSHWSPEHQLIFSTSDNSDPNMNGREYVIAWD